MNFSRAHSPAESNNSESSANSPGDSSSAGKRRTRASKPKVRTGCITCKIRRVKCGEEKPDCLRCTSTGRKCDGYDATLAPSRALSSMRAEESQRGMELARQEFLRAYQWNAALRSLRPIVADIEGTEAERRFFHAFRTAATSPENGGLTVHVSNVGHFWGRLAPQLAHRDGAVKHAIVALGAAYQLYQQSLDGNWSRVSAGGPCVEGLAGLRIRGSISGSGVNVASRGREVETEELELFTIQQYNKSISLLSRHASSSSTESIQLTLVCCIAFICLETLRSNHAAALTHLTNGLRILDSLPPEAFDFLAADVKHTITDGGSSESTSRNPSAPPSPPALQQRQQQQSDQLEASSVTPDMREIIRMFCCLECSAALFASDMRPSLALRGYAARRLDDGSTTLPQPSNGGFQSLAEAHAHCNAYAKDVIAHCYETAGHRWADDPSPEFWSDPGQRRHRSVLRARSRHLRALLDAFAAGPRGPRPDTPEYYSLQVDQLHVLTMNMLGGLYVGKDDSGNGGGGRSEGVLGQHQPGGSYCGDVGPLDPSILGLDMDLDMTSELLAGDIGVSVGPSNGGSLQATLVQMVDVASVMAQTARNMRQQRQQQRGSASGGVGGGGVRGFTYDMGLVAPMYVVATSAEDPAVRQRALRLLQESTVREGFWDGPALYSLVRRVGGMIAQQRWPFQQVARSLTGLGGIPEVWLTLEGLELEDVEG